MLTVKGEAGPEINIISNIQSIQVSCASVEAEEAEGWRGMAIVLTAENKDPDNSPFLKTSIGFIWIFFLGWLLSNLEKPSQFYALNFWLYVALLQMSCEYVLS